MTTSLNTNNTSANPSFQPSSLSAQSRASPSNTNTPAVLISPKRRKRTKKDGTYDRSDEAVWDLDDATIIDAAIAKWSSKTYEHFLITLRRVEREGQKIMYYRFTCKFNPDDHHYHERLRGKTSSGTANMKSGADHCDRDRGVLPLAPADPSAPSNYSASAHRTIIALRSATSHRPFNMVNDKYYRMEVELLRPGTIIPHATTISNDVKYLYSEISKTVRNYFKKRNRSVHLAVDGWTAPIVASFLGIVVIWYDEGKIHRAILEFIRLTKSHTGKYLAKVLAECMKRFGLEDFLHTICMDNAANCDTTASEAGALLPRFRGTVSRTRCCPHICSLIAKIFTSFFFKQYKRKKKVTIAAGTKRKRNQDLTGTPPVIEYEEELVLEEGDILLPEDDELVKTFEDEDVMLEDVGQGVHDKRIVKTLRERAIADMARKGITISPADSRMALAIFPKVAGLAQRVHDSGTLGEKFKIAIQLDDQLTGEKTSLDRRVPTRWNSDFCCLEAHIHFKIAVQSLTTPAVNNLKAFRLTDDQWALAERLATVLPIFDAPTKVFSQAELPLIPDVIPMLEDLESALTRVRDAARLPAVICVAAHASLLLSNKYYTLTDECEVYRISIVMCPDKKLEYFAKRGWSAEDINDACQLVIKQWEESYKPILGNAATAASVPTTPVCGSEWLTPIATEPNRLTDSIYTYLEDPIVPAAALQIVGGVMEYWYKAEAHSPNLAAMGADFCSAPASSTDAERAFSGGRLETNFLQHNTTSQTFKASMALGSWDGTPLMPEFSETVNLMKRKMSHPTVEADNS